jgi:large repetitive protein
MGLYHKFVDGSRLPSLVLVIFCTKIFLSLCLEEKNMPKISKFTAILLVVVLIMQLIGPVSNTFANTPIGIPNNLTVNITNTNDINLKWDPVSGSGRVRYKVYSINDNQRVYLGLATTNSWSIQKAAAGKHTMAVSTVIDGSESELSTPVQFEIIFPIVNSPSGLTARLFNISDLELKWSTVPNISTYNIYKIVNGTREFIGSTASTNKYLFNLSEGENIYEVASVSDRFGESKGNGQISVTVTYPKLSPPKGLTYNVYNGNDVQLSWQTAENASSYRVYKLVDGKKQFLSNAPFTNKYLFELPEGEYTYLVSSVSDRFGESVEQSNITVKIVNPTVKAPEGLKAALYNQNDLLLQWNPVEYAIAYKIYEVINDERIHVTTTSATNKFITYLPKGEHTYEVKAISERFGESTFSLPITVNVVFPEVHSPQDLVATVENGNTVYLKWKAAEYASQYKVFEVLNGIKVQLSNTAATSIRLTGQSEGEHIYYVSSVNDRFGESISASQVSVIVGNPELLAPIAKILVKENNDVLISWEKVDFASDYTVYKIENDTLIPVETVNALSFTVGNLLDGKHEFVVTANNEYFGKSPNSNVVTAYLKPNFETPQTSEPVITGNEVVIGWSPVTGAASYNVYKVEAGKLTLVENITGTNIAIENLAPGNYEFRIVPVSPSGNEGEKYSTVIVKAEQFDTTPPQTVANETEDWNQGEYQVELTATDNQSGVDKTYYSLNGTDFDEGSTVTISEEGTRTIYFYSVDKAGNIEEVKITKIKIDNTAPETVLGITDVWNKGEVTVNLTASDDHSGVAKTFYSVNGTSYVEGTSFSVSTDGLHQVSFYSMDNAGNIEEAKMEVIKIDSVSPVTSSDITDEWKNGDVTVNLTATDDLSGVAKTFYSIDGSAYTEGNTFTISKEGITQVSYYSVDNAGNQEAAKIEEVMIDNTAPVTTSDITDQWNKDAVSVNLTVTDNLSGVDKTYYSINGSEFSEGTSFTVTGDGIIEVSYYSVDKAGNQEAVKTEFVKMDNTAPGTASDVTDKWNTGYVTVKLTANDNQSGVATTYYSVNGYEYVEGTEFVVSDEGINNVSFYSVDKVGNKEEAKSVDVKIDKTAPTTVSDGNDKWNKADVTVNLSATDNLSGVAKTYYSINGSEYVEGNQLTVTEEGINKVSFYSVDNAGNQEEPQTVEVKVDETAPVVSWDPATQYALGASLPLSYKATDEHSGIAKETITVDGKVYENTENVKLDKPGTYKVAVTVTDHAGWTTTLEKTIQVYVPATLIVNPGVIKANTGDFTVKIVLPEGFDTNLVDLSTATLNGVSAKSGTNGLVQQAKNGQFKFNRNDFDWKKGTVTVEFRVLVNGILVIGSTTVEVK